jgi:ribosomal protein S18 acetylase RimI-like enzyme
MEVVKATAEDAVALVDISRKTFYDSFHHLNSEANMVTYMDQAFTLEKLSQELANDNSYFYFGKNGQDILGYFKLNRKEAQSEFHDDDSLEIERIYVDSSYQGAGLGTVLLNKAKEIAAQSGCKYLWLGVWENNPAAIRFYERNGFEIFSSHKFQMGDDEQTDLLMICKMK